jgi:AcrR family transcriptional regulator
VTKQTKTTVKLERQNWVDAATEAMKSNGVAGVRVDVLAKKLGITRGSFYWHFKKRQDLLDAVLSNWEQVGTLGIINELENLEESAAIRLENLLTLAFSSTEESFAFERAVRAWAITSDKVKEVVVRVDTQRIEYLRQLYSELGWPSKKALQHAKHVYYIRTGLFHQGELPNLNERIKSVNYLLNILIKKN